MARETVLVSGRISASPDIIWSIVRDFCSPWHPAVSSMDAEYDQSGHLTRVFTVHGEDTVYRERLTWFSDSGRSYAYALVEGISGVHSYNAQMRITEGSDGGSKITMSAECVAPKKRVREIAEGTRAVFEGGINALAKRAANVRQPLLLGAENQEHEPINHKVICGQPELAVSYAMAPSAIQDTLCLFLHGIGGNRTNWDGQVLAVSQHCRAASFDLRGYGESERGTAQSTIDDYCDDILRVFNALGAKRLVLCGLSYGAWIATSFAMRYPSCLSGLVLAGGCTGMSEADELERTAFRESRVEPLKQGKTPADFAPNVVQVLAGPDIQAETFDTILASISAISADTYADALQCFTNPTETFDFSRLLIPTVLMTGEFDRLAPTSEIENVAQRIFKASLKPDVRFECLKRVGHLCNLEDADAFNAPLLDLIKRITLYKNGAELD